ncbi:MAG: hypothetical protein NVSMB30_11610 [Hymenobacter sp.]
MQNDAFFSDDRAAGGLGGVQHDIFFSVMKIIHRQSPLLPAVSSDKVARLSCCCRISELLPLVRQLHDEARVRARLSADSQQAA